MWNHKTIGYWITITEPKPEHLKLCKIIKSARKKPSKLLMEQSSFNRLCCSNCVTTPICMHKHRHDLYNMHDGYWKLKWKCGNFITFSFTLNWFFSVGLRSAKSAHTHTYGHTYQDHLYFAVVCMSFALSISADCQANKVFVSFYLKCNNSHRSAQHGTMSC